MNTLKHNVGEIFKLNHQKFISYLQLNHLDLQVTNNYIKGVWKGKIVEYLILDANENGEFFLLTYEKEVKRYEGNYIVVYEQKEDKYYMFRTSDIDFRICVEQKFQMVVKEDKNMYESLYLFEVQDLVRRVI
ncbi:MAG: hypothetical protein PHN69_02565 [Candidatus Pacebacteria bacterium]|nr:hypothetical protein [Candidatus Paceibacterota bacterium]